MPDQDLENRERRNENQEERVEAPPPTIVPAQQDQLRALSEGNTVARDPQGRELESRNVPFPISISKILQDRTLHQFFQSGLSRFLSASAEFAVQRGDQTRYSVDRPGGGTESSATVERLNDTSVRVSASDSLFGNLSMRVENGILSAFQRGFQLNLPSNSTDAGHNTNTGAPANGSIDFDPARGPDNALQINGEPNSQMSMDKIRLAMQLIQTTALQLSESLGIPISLPEAVLNSRDNISAITTGLLNLFQSAEVRQQTQEGAPESGTQAGANRWNLSTISNSFALQNRIADSETPLTAEQRQDIRNQFSRVLGENANPVLDLMLDAQALPQRRGTEDIEQAELPAEQSDRIGESIQRLVDQNSTPEQIAAARQSLSESLAALRQNGELPAQFRSALLDIANQTINRDARFAAHDQLTALSPDGSTPGNEHDRAAFVDALSAFLRLGASLYDPFGNGPGSRIMLDAVINNADQPSSDGVRPGEVIRELLGTNSQARDHLLLSIERRVNDPNNRDRAPQITQLLNDLFPVREGQRLDPLSLQHRVRIENMGTDGFSHLVASRGSQQSNIALANILAQNISAEHPERLGQALERWMTANQLTTPEQRQQELGNIANNIPASHPQRAALLASILRSDSASESPQLQSAVLNALSGSNESNTNTIRQILQGAPEGSAAARTLAAANLVQELRSGQVSRENIASIIRGGDRTMLEALQIASPEINQEAAAQILSQARENLSSSESTDAARIASLNVMRSLARFAGTEDVASMNLVLQNTRDNNQDLRTAASRFAMDVVRQSTNTELRQSALSSLANNGWSADTNSELQELVWTGRQNITFSGGTRRVEQETAPLANNPDFRQAAQDIMTRASRLGYSHSYYADDGSSRSSYDSLISGLANNPARLRTFLNNLHSSVDFNDRVLNDVAAAGQRQRQQIMDAFMRTDQPPESSVLNSLARIVSERENPEYVNRLQARAANGDRSALALITSISTLGTESYENTNTNNQVILSARESLNTLAARPELRQHILTQLSSDFQSFSSQMSHRQQRQAFAQFAAMEFSPQEPVAQSWQRVQSAYLSGLDENSSRWLGESLRSQLLLNEAARVNPQVNSQASAFSALESSARTGNSRSIEVLSQLGRADSQSDLQRASLDALSRLASNTTNESSRREAQQALLSLARSDSGVRLLVQERLNSALANDRGLIPLITAVSMNLESIPNRENLLAPLASALNSGDRTALQLLAMIGSQNDANGRTARRALSQTLLNPPTGLREGLEAALLPIAASSGEMRAEIVNSLSSSQGNSRNLRWDFLAALSNGSPTPTRGNELQTIGDAAIAGNEQALRILALGYQRGDETGSVQRQHVQASLRDALALTPLPVTIDAIARSNGEFSPAITDSLFPRNMADQIRAQLLASQTDTQRESALLALSQFPSNRSLPPNERERDTLIDNLISQSRANTEQGRRASLELEAYGLREGNAILARLSPTQAQDRDIFARIVGRQSLNNPELNLQNTIDGFLSRVPEESRAGARQQLEHSFVQNLSENASLGNRAAMSSLVRVVSGDFSDSTREDARQNIIRLSNQNELHTEQFVSLLSAPNIGINPAVISTLGQIASRLDVLPAGTRNTLERAATLLADSTAGSNDLRRAQAEASLSLMSAGHNLGQRSMEQFARALAGDADFAQANADRLRALSQAQNAALAPALVGEINRLSNMPVTEQNTIYLRNALEALSATASSMPPASAAALMSNRALLNRLSGTNADAESLSAMANIVETLFQSRNENIRNAAIAYLGSSAAFWGQLNDPRAAREAAIQLLSSENASIASAGRAAVSRALEADRGLLRDWLNPENTRENATLNHIAIETAARTRQQIPASDNDASQLLATINNTSTPEPIRQLARTLLLNTQASGSEANFSETTRSQAREAILAGTSTADSRNQIVNAAAYVGGTVLNGLASLAATNQNIGRALSSSLLENYANTNERNRSEVASALARMPNAMQELNNRLAGENLQGRQNAAEILAQISQANSAGSQEAREMLVAFASSSEQNRAIAWRGVASTMDTAGGNLPVLARIATGTTQNAANSEEALNIISQSARTGNALAAQSLGLAASTLNAPLSETARNSLLEIARDRSNSDGAAAADRVLTLLGLQQSSSESTWNALQQNLNTTPELINVMAAISAGRDRPVANATEAMQLLETSAVAGNQQALALLNQLIDNPTHSQNALQSLLQISGSTTNTPVASQVQNLLLDRAGNNSSQASIIQNALMQRLESQTNPQDWRLLSAILSGGQLSDQSNNRTQLLDALRAGNQNVQEFFRNVSTRDNALGRESLSILTGAAADTPAARDTLFQLSRQSAESRERILNNLLSLPSMNSDLLNLSTALVLGAERVANDTRTATIRNLRQAAETGNDNAIRLLSRMAASNLNSSDAPTALEAARALQALAGSGDTQRNRVLEQASIAYGRFAPRDAAGANSYLLQAIINIQERQFSRQPMPSANAESQVRQWLNNLNQIWSNRTTNSDRIEPALAPVFARLIDGASGDRIARLTEQSVSSAWMLTGTRLSLMQNMIDTYNATGIHSRLPFQSLSRLAYGDTGYDGLYGSPVHLRVEAQRNFENFLQTRLNDALNGRSEQSPTFTHANQFFTAMAARRTGGSTLDTDLYNAIPSMSPERQQLLLNLYPVLQRFQNRETNASDVLALVGQQNPLAIAGTAASQRTLDISMPDLNRLANLRIGLNAESQLNDAQRRNIREFVDGRMLEALTRANTPQAQRAAFDYFQTFGWTATNRTEIQAAMNTYAREQTTANPGDRAFTDRASLTSNLSSPLPAEAMLRQMGINVDSRVQSLIDQIRSRQGSDESINSALINWQRFQALSPTMRALYLNDNPMSLMPPVTSSIPDLQAGLQRISQQQANINVTPLDLLATMAGEQNAQSDSARRIISNSGDIGAVQQRLNQVVAEMQRRLPEIEQSSQIGYDGLRESARTGGGTFNFFYNEFEQAQRIDLNYLSANAQIQAQARDLIDRYSEHVRTLNFSNDVQRYYGLLSNGNRSEADRAALSLIGNYGAGQVSIGAPEIFRDVYRSGNQDNVPFLDQGIFSRLIANGNSPMQLPQFNLGSAGVWRESLDAISNSSRAGWSDDSMRRSMTDYIVNAMNSNPEYARLHNLNANMVQELNGLQELFSIGMSGSRSDEFTNRVRERANRLEAVLNDMNRINTSGMLREVEQTLSSMGQGPERERLTQIRDFLRQVNTVQENWRHTDGRGNRDGNIYTMLRQIRAGEFDSSTALNWFRQNSGRLALEAVIMAGGIALAGFTGGGSLVAARATSAAIWARRAYTALATTTLMRASSHASAELNRSLGITYHGSSIADSFRADPHHNGALRNDVADRLRAPALGNALGQELRDSAITFAATLTMSSLFAPRVPGAGNVFQPAPPTSLLTGLGREAVHFGREAGWQLTTSHVQAAMAEGISALGVNHEIAGHAASFLLAGGTHAMPGHAGNHEAQNRYRRSSSGEIVMEHTFSTNAEAATNIRRMGGTVLERNGSFVQLAPIPNEHIPAGNNARLQTLREQGVPVTQMPDGSHLANFSERAPEIRVSQAEAQALMRQGIPVETRGNTIDAHGNISSREYVVRGHAPIELRAVSPEQFNRTTPNQGPASNQSEHSNSNSNQNQLVNRSNTLLLEPPQPHAAPAHLSAPGAEPSPVRNNPARSRNNSAPVIDPMTGEPTHQTQARPQVRFGTHFASADASVSPANRTTDGAAVLSRLNSLPAEVRSGMERLVERGHRGIELANQYLRLNPELRRLSGLDQLVRNQQQHTIEVLQTRFNEVITEARRPLSPDALAALSHRDPNIAAGGGDRVSPDARAVIENWISGRASGAPSNAALERLLSWNRSQIDAFIDVPNSQAMISLLERGVLDGNTAARISSLDAAERPAFNSFLQQTLSSQSSSQPAINAFLDLMPATRNSLVAQNLPGNHSSLLLERYQRSGGTMTEAQLISLGTDLQMLQRSSNAPSESTIQRMFGLPASELSVPDLHNYMREILSSRISPPQMEALMQAPRSVRDGVNTLLAVEQTRPANERTGLGELMNTANRFAPSVEAGSISWQGIAELQRSTSANAPVLQGMLLSQGQAPANQRISAENFARLTELTRNNQITPQGIEAYRRGIELGVLDNSSLSQILSRETPVRQAYESLILAAPQADPAGLSGHLTRGPEHVVAQAGSLPQNIAAHLEPGLFGEVSRLNGTRAPLPGSNAQAVQDFANAIAEHRYSDALRISQQGDIRSNWTPHEISFADFHNPTSLRQHLDTMPGGRLETPARDATTHTEGTMQAHMPEVHVRLPNNEVLNLRTGQWGSPSTDGTVNFRSLESRSAAEVALANQIQNSQAGQVFTARMALSSFEERLVHGFQSNSGTISSVINPFMESAAYHRLREHYRGNPSALNAAMAEIDVAAVLHQTGMNLQQIRNFLGDRHLSGEREFFYDYLQVREAFGYYQGMNHVNYYLWGQHDQLFGDDAERARRDVPILLGGAVPTSSDMVTYRDSTFFNRPPSQTGVVDSPAFVATTPQPDARSMGMDGGTTRRPIYIPAGTRVLSSTSIYGSVEMIDEILIVPSELHPHTGPQGEGYIIRPRASGGQRPRE